MTTKKSTAPRHRSSAFRTVMLLLISCILFSLLVLPGIRWGLPSDVRNALTFGPDPADWRAPYISAEESAEPWTYYPNYLVGGAERTGSAPRSAYNPVRSYHPDEYVFFKSLSRMKPSKLDIFPGFFGWPAFQIYLVGAVLKGASFFGFVTLNPDVDFYFKNPEAMAQLYIVGRLLTWVFGLGCIVLIGLAARKLFGEVAAGAAALLLAITPLFTVNSRYLTADVPMMFWICATLLASAYILQGARWRAYIIAGICLGLAAATRYQGGVAAFVILAAHVLRDRTQEKSETTSDGTLGAVVRRLMARDLWFAAGVSVLVFLMANPYILFKWPQFWMEFSGELRGSWNPTSFLALTAMFAESGWGVFYTLATLAAIMLAGVRSDRHVRFVLLAFGIPAVILWIGKPVMVRYLLPVAPLPPLICAWAFAQVHRRGMELGRRATRLAAPILLCIVLSFTLFQTIGQNALYFRAQNDTRTRAGMWSLMNLPAGASLGVLSEPWQFELPPLDKNLYQVMIMQPSLQALADKKPEYFIASDLQFPPVGIRDPLSAEEEAFRNEVMKGDDTYSVMARFDAWPLGRRTMLRRGPHDMRYANPVIVVVQRKPR